MAITDLQISDTLETGAPSIKYTGNEGPQAPQQMASMEAGQEGTLEDIYQELIGQGFSPREAAEKAKEIYNSMGDMSRAPQQGRRMAAGGGIMGSNNGSMLAARTADGSRPKYGFLDRIRKLIPNEIAGVAEKAAPFVAPFNPIAGGLMAGIGGYDRTGNLMGSAVRGLGTYGLGQGARYLGGADLQKGLSLKMPGGIGNYFSKPTGSNPRFFDDLFKGKETITKKISDSGNKFTDVARGTLSDPQEKLDFIEKTTETGKNLSAIGNFIEKNSKAILLGSMGIAAATAKPQDVQEAMRVSRGTGLDIDGIRKEVQEALAGGEEAWAILQQKYPYVGEFPTKKAEGGRIGLYAGGVPSPYSMEDARKTSMQDKMGGITDVMKRADLFRSGDVGQMYMAQGGRIGAEEGGLMNLGGMEKDYRNDGGFVPIGEYEKKDDVPARLSKNEFVFTADAVRGAGGGDIDKGAEMMENMMKHLEQGGQISEDSQGLAGAQEMFDVSERIGEVI